MHRDFLIIAPYKYSYLLTYVDKPPQCHLPTQLEDVPVSTILGTLSALEALCDYALYKSTFTLHYINRLLYVSQLGRLSL